MTTQPYAAHMVPAGWYPDDNGVLRFWDGRAWTGHAHYAPAQQQDRTLPLVGGLTAGVLIIVGVVCNIQSVSLLSGSGIVWVGTALAVAGAVVAVAVPRVRTWVKVIAVIAALITVANGVYVEHQLSQKRDQLEHIFNTP
jgi:uncharacterized protein DUF2510